MAANLANDDADQLKTRQQLQLPREQAARLGREAVAIIDAGRYTAPSGRVIEIKPLVERAVKGTVSYPPSRDLPQDRPAHPRIQAASATEIPVVNQTTLAAVLRMRADGLEPAALNMASATSPGGGFLSGARAQEEYLARSSALYACLRGNPMYAFHGARQDPFYSDYVINSPEVPVFRGDDGDLLEAVYPCSILTSPAVEAGGVARYMPQREKDIGPVMEKRIQKLLAVAVAHGHTALVLGAWGCGAFGNDGTLVAGLFRASLQWKFRGVFKRVVFAIVDWSDDGRFIEPFRKVFGT